MVEAQDDTKNATGSGQGAASGKQAPQSGAVDAEGKKRQVLCPRKHYPNVVDAVNRSLVLRFSHERFPRGS